MFVEVTYSLKQFGSNRKLKKKDTFKRNGIDEERFYWKIK